MEDFFERLGENIKSHILGFFNAIPNVLAAILWLVLAFVIATVVRNLVVKVLKALKIDKFYEIKIVDSLDYDLIGEVER